MLLGDGARSLEAGGKLERVNPADIGAFYEREIPALVLFVAVSTGLDIHSAADVSQTAFEKSLHRWPTLCSPASSITATGRSPQPYAKAAPAGHRTSGRSRDLAAVQEERRPCDGSGAG